MRNLAALVAGSKRKGWSGWEMDEMAYDLMMGNFATRVTLFHSKKEERC
jgi:hypothetical protein